MNARTTTPTPFFIFDKVMVDVSHPRTRASATILWKALEEMFREGETNYTIAVVGRYSERIGGPKAQSIRNRSGALFRQLIAAFASYQGQQTTKTNRRPRDNIDRALEDIQDLGARTVIKMLLEKGRRLERENDMLRSSFKQISINSPGQTVTAGSRRDELVPSTDAMFTTAPIQKFLSDQWISGRFWRIEPNGSIVDEVTDGRVIAPPGFIDALRLIISSRNSAD